MDCINNSIEALRNFKGRTSEKEKFIKIFNDFKEKVKSGNNFSCDLLSYCGVGGIGKTALMKELENYYKSDNLGKYCIEYDFNNSTDTRQILTRWRNMLVDLDSSRFVFVRFDMACMSYAKEWGDIDSGIKEREEFIKKSSWLSPLLEAGSLIEKAVMPIQILKACIEAGYLINDYRLEKKIEETSSELKGMSNDEKIEIILPKYFYMDMQDCMKDSLEPLVIFLDTYEVLVNKLCDNGSENDRWLWDITNGVFCKIPNVLWVIFGRDKLEQPWATMGFKDIESRICEMGNLLPQDSRDFLKDAQIPAHFYDAIIDLTQGNPLWLNVVVKTYENCINAGTEFSLEGIESTDILVRRYQSYMDDGMKDLVKQLAIIGEWTDESREQILGEINETTYSKVEKSCFIKKLDNKYIMHELVRKAIFGICVKDNYRPIKRIYEKACEFYSQKLKACNCITDEYDTLISLRNFYEFIHSQMTPESLEMVEDKADQVLNDIVNAIDQVAEQYVNAQMPNHAIGWFKENCRLLENKEGWNERLAEEEVKIADLGEREYYKKAVEHYEPNDWKVLETQLKWVSFCERGSDEQKELATKCYERVKHRPDSEAEDVFEYLFYLRKILRQNTRFAHDQLSFYKLQETIFDELGNMIDKGVGNTNPNADWITYERELHEQTDERIFIIHECNLVLEKLEENPKLLEMSPDEMYFEIFGERDSEFCEEGKENTKGNNKEKWIKGFPKLKETLIEYINRIPEEERDFVMEEIIKQVFPDCYEKVYAGDSEVVDWEDDPVQKKSKDCYSVVNTFLDAYDVNKEYNETELENLLVFLLDTWNEDWYLLDEGTIEDVMEKIYSWFKCRYDGKYSSIYIDVIIKVSDIYSSIGSAKGNLSTDEFEKAKTKQKEAYDLIKTNWELIDPSDREKLLRDLAEAEYSSSSVREAETIMEELYDLYKEKHGCEDNAECIDVLQTLALKKDGTERESRLRKAYDLIRSNSELAAQVNIGIVLRDLAEVERSLEKSAEARKYFKELRDFQNGTEIFGLDQRTQDFLSSMKRAVDQARKWRENVCSDSEDEIKDLFKHVYKEDEKHVEDIIKGFGRIIIPPDVLETIIEGLNVLPAE